MCNLNKANGTGDKEKAKSTFTQTLKNTATTNSATTAARSVAPELLQSSRTTARSATHPRNDPVHIAAGNTAIADGGTNRDGETPVHVASRNVAIADGHAERAGDKIRTVRPRILRTLLHVEVPIPDLEDIGLSERSPGLGKNPICEVASQIVGGTLPDAEWRSSWASYDSPNQREDAPFARSGSTRTKKHPL